MIETWDRTSLGEQEAIIGRTKGERRAAGPARRVRRARLRRPRAPTASRSIADGRRTSGWPTRPATAAPGCCAAATTSSTAPTGWAGSTPGCSSWPTSATRAGSSCRCRRSWPRNDAHERVHPARLQRPVRLPARGRAAPTTAGARAVQLSDEPGIGDADRSAGPAGRRRGRRGRRCDGGGGDRSEVGPERRRWPPGCGAAAACRAGAVRPAPPPGSTQPGCAGGGGGVVTAATSAPGDSRQPGPVRLARSARLRARKCRTARASSSSSPVRSRVAAQPARPAA